MPSETPPPPDRSTTRRDLLLGSAALLTPAATGGAATAADNADKPTIKQPRATRANPSPPFLVPPGFFASGTVPSVINGVKIVAVKGYLTRHGSPDPVDPPPIRTWIRTQTTPYTWGMQFRSVPEGEYDLHVRGIDADGKLTDPDKVWIRVGPYKPPKRGVEKFPSADGTAKAKLSGPPIVQIKSTTSEYPTANGDTVPPYFVAYGTYSEASHYVVQATMTDDQNPPVTYYPIAIINQPTDYAVEFLLPEDGARQYTLTIIDAYYHVESFTGLTVVP